MDELKVSDMQLSRLSKLYYQWFPKQARTWYGNIKNKFKTASELVDKVNMELDNQSILLQNDVSRVDSQIKGMDALTEKLNDRIAAVEVYYEALKEAVEKVEEQSQGAEVKDRQKRELFLDKQSELARLARRLDSLKTFRLKCFQSSTKQKNMKRAYADEVEMLQDLQTDTTLTYQIGIQDGLSAHRIEQGAETIRQVRGYNEKVTEATDDMVGKAMEKNRTEFMTGVHDLDKLKASVQKTVDLAQKTKQHYDNAVEHYETMAATKEELDKLLTDAALETNDLSALETPKAANE